MEMAFRLAHGKAQGNLVKKRRIGCRYLLSGKIVPRAERQFVTADRDRPVVDQWLIGSARPGTRISSRAARSSP